MNLAAATLGAEWGFGPIWEIVRKPDNIPIIMMMVLVGFFIWLSFSQARRNDRLKKETSDPKRDIFYPPEEAAFPVRVHVWPWLLRNEFLSAIWIMIILMAWSIGLDAPLEDPANPNLTPNPSKAPWYFLGLQEMLVYFDPWIAGVVAPTLIIVGLMAIPYIDVNPKGNGYYTFQERPFAISVFMFGFILWVILIVIGTFVRGPGWIWFWPGQHWDPHAVVSQTNIDLPQWFFSIFGKGVGAKFATKDQFGSITVPHMVVGGLAVLGYFGAMMVAPYLWLKKKKAYILEDLGLVRYGITAFLFASMMGLVFKVLLRIVFNVKYVLVTPYARF